MDDDDILAAWAHELELEHREECEHGIHPDSGHYCMACLADIGDFDAE